MASQVFSGTNKLSFTYTNNTGQNVRVVINYLNAYIPASFRPLTLSAGDLNLSYSYEGGTSVTLGRNLAFYKYVQNLSLSDGTTIAGNNAYVTSTQTSNYQDELAGFPTELMLSPGQVFAINVGSNNGAGGFSYNIVVIPEAG